MKSHNEKPSLSVPLGNAKGTSPAGNEANHAERVGGKVKRDEKAIAKRMVELFKEFAQLQVDHPDVADAVGRALQDELNRRLEKERPA